MPSHYTIKLKNGNIITEAEILRDFKGKIDFTRKDFSMFFLEVNKKIIAVDLVSGLFYMGNQLFNPDYALQKHQFTLIYYKRTHFALGKNPIAPHKIYLLGWKFTENGQCHKRIMFLDEITEIITIRRKR